MNVTRILAVLAMLAGACGGGGGGGTGDMAMSSDMAMSGGGPDMTVDPLVGTWTSSATSGGVTFNHTYKFNADNTVTFHAADLDSSTNCTNTLDHTGTWSTNGTMLTMVPVSGTHSNTGCTNPSFNYATKPDTGLVTFTVTYAVSGTTLTFTFAPGSNPATETLTRS
jgi:hypothetical protein